MLILSAWMMVVVVVVTSQTITKQVNEVKQGIASVVAIVKNEPRHLIQSSLSFTDIVHRTQKGSKERIVEGACLTCTATSVRVVAQERIGPLSVLMSTIQGLARDAQHIVSFMPPNTYNLATEDGCTSMKKNSTTTQLFDVIYMHHVEKNVETSRITCPSPHTIALPVHPTKTTTIVLNGLLVRGPFPTTAFVLQEGGNVQHNDKARTALRLLLLLLARTIKPRGGGAEHFVVTVAFEMPDEVDVGTLLRWMEFTASPSVVEGAAAFATGFNLAHGLVPLECLGVGLTCASWTRLWAMRSCNEEIKVGKWDAFVFRAPVLTSSPMKKEEMNHTTEEVASPVVIPAKPVTSRAPIITATTAATSNNLYKCTVLKDNEAIKEPRNFVL